MAELTKSTTSSQTITAELSYLENDAVYRATSRRRQCIDSASYICDQPLKLQTSAERLPPSECETNEGSGDERPLGGSSVPATHSAHA